MSYGNFECKCRDGFRGDGYTQCIDIDECAEGTASCGNARCVNVPGSYRCDCEQGQLCSQADSFIPSEYPSVVVDTIDKFELKPPLEIHIRQDDPSEWSEPGWIVRRKGESVHVHVDLPLGVRNKEVGYYVVSYHAEDSQGVPFPVRRRIVIVEDIDECRSGTHKCSQFADCHNRNGSYACECTPGFVGDGYSCVRQDPCRGTVHNCDPVHGECIPDGSPRGYRCACRRGFEGDGTRCVDINECLSPSAYFCPEHSHCVNSVGSYSCECDPGWEKLTLSTDICAPGDVPCVDVDECAKGTHRCGVLEHCVNTAGSFYCRCKEGYERSAADNVCRKVYGFSWELLGPNPYHLKQCDSYTEHSFRIDDRADEKARVRIGLPSELMEDVIVATGSYVVNYTLTDQTGKTHQRSRRVVVEAVNPCDAALVGTPCGHRCIAPAVCVPGSGSGSSSSSNLNYKCVCPSGYALSDDERSCVNIVFKLLGPNPYYRYACKVCETVFTYSGEQFDEDRVGGYQAWVEYPDGSKRDLTGRVATRAVALNSTHTQILYEVEFGGQRTGGRRMLITLEEDKHRDIEMLKEQLLPALRTQVKSEVGHEIRIEAERKGRSIVYRYLGELWDYFRWLGFIVLVVLFFLTVPPILHAAYIVYGKNRRDVTRGDFEDAYIYLCNFVHPFWSKSKREKEAHLLYEGR